MTNKVASSRAFIRGSARYADLVYILSKGKDLLQEDVAHTSAICVDRGQWADAEDVEWDSTAIAVAKQPSEKLVFIGEDGDVCTYVSGASTVEQIKPAPKMIRNARAIEGYVYACGLLRQVYKRIGEGEWRNVSAPGPKPEEKVGFEALDGFSEKEIYAVGWSGEIWEYNGKKWMNRTSPTNVILNAVCCAGDAMVYVAGQQGVMLKGRHERWDTIEWEEEVGADIWDLCWFKNKLYVATMTDLYTLQGNQLEEVDFGDLEISSFYSLTQEEGVMWSIGKEDVLSFDGTTWRSYE